MQIVHPTRKYQDTGIQRIKLEVEKAGLTAPVFSFDGHFSVVTNKASALKNGILNIAQMFEQLSDKQMVEFFNTHYPTASGIVNGTVNKQQKQILLQVLSGKYRNTELVKK